MSKRARQSPTKRKKKRKRPARAERSSGVEVKFAIVRSLAPVAFFIALAALFLPFTVDDAYISLRYAENWASGDGLVFNPGERVEGFSNFLWVLLLGIGATLGATQDGLVVFSKVLGVACGAGVVLALAFSGSRSATKASVSTSKSTVSRGHLEGIVAAWLIAASGGFAYYAASGLETCLYALVVLGLALTYRPDASPRRAGLVVGLAVLAAMTRPEGAVLLGAALLAGLVLWRGRSRWVVVPGVVAGAGLLALRQAYYGAWIPNTAVAKSGVSDLADLSSGLNYVHGGLLEDGRYLWLLVVVVLLVRKPAVRSRAAAPAALLLAGLGFAIYSGGDWMARSRYLVPYVPVLALLAGGALVRLAGTGHNARQLIVIATGASVLATGFFALQFRSDLSGGGKYDHAHVSTGNVEIGKWLHANTQPDAAIITDEIGAVGFYSDRRVLDVWGLVDPEIAELFRSLSFNPYAGGSDASVRGAAQQKMAEILVARGATHALVDYRGPDGDFQKTWVNSQTMRELMSVLEANDFVYRRRFELDPKAPKAMVLYRRQ